MARTTREQFLRAEGRARRAVAAAGLTEPDFVLPDLDPGRLVLQWTEPDLVELILSSGEVDGEGVPPDVLAPAVVEIVAKMRDLISRNAMPPADIVRPGRNLGDIEFIWRREKAIVILSEDEQAALEGLN